MIDYLNPADLGDFSPQGLSSGTATDVFVYAAGLAIDPETMARRKEAESIADETGSASRTSPGSWRTQASHCETSSRPPATCRTRHIASTSSMHTSAFGEGPYPARSTFVLGIASNLRVQIEAVAVRPDAA